MPLTASDVQQATFALRRGGYATHEVDEFLDLAAQALTGEARLTPAEVDGVRFTTSLVRKGYAMQEVDAFLDELKASLAGPAGRTGSGQAVRSSQVSLVVGVGNPGPAYAGNRHNLGYLVVERLAERMGGRLSAHRRTGCELLEGRLAGQRVVLAKPRSYMNLSGGPVASVMKFFKIESSAVVIVHDELDLPFGTVRLKRGGGEAGHNGLRSISQSISSRDYLRVRFGIGRPPGRMDPATFVLRDFSGAERRELDVLIEHCADATEALLANGLEAAQNQFH